LKNDEFLFRLADRSVGDAQAQEIRQANEEKYASTEVEAQGQSSPAYGEGKQKEESIVGATGWSPARRCIICGHIILRAESNQLSFSEFCDSCLDEVRVGAGFSILDFRFLIHSDRSEA
jgi:hypothetical protein